MRKMIAWLLCILMLLSNSALATSTMTFVSDYSVAEKMWKQLTAGSGLKGSGTLRTSGEKDVSEPTRYTLEAIYVRPDENGDGAEIHADLSWDEDSVQVKQVDDVFYAKTGALGEEWVSFENFLQEQTSFLALPSFLYASLPALLTEETNDPRYQKLLDDMLIQIDFWLETYRDTAEMQKDEDGVSSIVMKYTVSKEEIKAQVKYLITSLFSDSKTLAMLQSFLTTEQATQFLNPHLQDFYMAAIDALPIATDLRVERAVNIAGETTALRVSLPLCDMNGDPLIIRYEGAQKGEDLLHVVAIDSNDRHMQMQFQTETIDDVLLIQAKVSSVDDTEAGFFPNVSFAFQAEISDVSKTNEEGEDENTKHMKITIGKDPEADADIPHLFDVPAIEANALLTFTSKPLTNAATSVAGEVILEWLDTDQTSTLNFEAETTPKWIP